MTPRLNILQAIGISYPPVNRMTPVRKDLCKGCSPGPTTNDTKFHVAKLGKNQPPKRIISRIIFPWELLLLSYPFLIFC